MAIDRDLALSLEEPLLDPEQAAALLNVRPSWIRDATRGAVKERGTNRQVAQVSADGG
jgi:hypothetical protein